MAKRAFAYIDGDLAKWADHFAKTNDLRLTSRAQVIEHALRELKRRVEHPALDEDALIAAALEFFRQQTERDTRRTSQSDRGRDKASDR